MTKFGPILSNLEQLSLKEAYCFPKSRPPVVHIRPYFVHNLGVMLVQFRPNVVQFRPFVGISLTLRSRIDYIHARIV